ncbi:competence protein CoiA family protein [Neobacillus drentensis]|uniref:competence protein CoiA n=1 Tax=Neobacillus drentensis TaxID=220684 RepID=UPI002FFE26C3
MLTAITKNGKKLCLGYDYKKESLLSLRSKEDFFCPICGESVLLKLGDHRIFHFAHKRGGACREFYDHESIYHLDGKRQLYQWLIKQNIPAVLEYFDKEIQQRPDILFKFNGKKYALEYQCSPIPEEIFSKRTKTYLENDYIPLWIIASRHLQLKQRDIDTLSNFHYLFLRSSLQGTFFIPSYCPEKQHFHLVESITPFSIKNAFTQHSFYSPDRLEITSLLSPKPQKRIFMPKWKIEMDRIIQNMIRYSDHHKKKFLLEIYNNCLNPFLLPPEIGLPVPHSILIQTPPVIWQTYVYLDLLSHKNPGDLITMQEIKQHLNRRVKRHEVVSRHLPQMSHLNPLLAVFEYLLYLTKLGVLSKVGETCFQVKQKICIPHSNREREEYMIQFNQKHGTLCKIINEN